MSDPRKKGESKKAEFLRFFSQTDSIPLDPRDKAYQEMKNDNIAKLPAEQQPKALLEDAVFHGYAGDVKKILELTQGEEAKYKINLSDLLTCIESCC